MSVYLSERTPRAAFVTLPTRVRMSQNRQIEVLVLDAHFRQALAAMRSLARAGVQVGAVACHSEAWAPAFKSRWCSFAAVVPDFADDAGGYVDALGALLDEYPARMILPSHDGSIEAIRPRRAELERRTFLPLASEAALTIAVSKPRTLALAKELNIAVPRGVLVSDGGDVRAAINEVGCPAVIKPVSSWGQRDGLGKQCGCAVALTVDEAKESVDAISAAGLKSLVQQWLPGRRDAVSIFFAAGKVWARFAQKSYREFPPLGGSSVLCESIPLRSDLTEPAERLVRTIGLDGCSMVEFRRDRAGQPVLMEINPRMAGSVALAISAGVDFPRLLYAWARQEPLHEIREYRVGRRLRWLSGDAWNLRTTFESQGRPDIPSRSAAVATFLTDFIRRPAKFDVVDAHDMMPAFADLRHTIMEPAFTRARELVGGRRSATPKTRTRSDAAPRR
jgi:predicted ATP-grasp superfamily ATP-dependent carboligase